MSQTRERKLSQDDVRQIVSLHRQGWTQKALAERFGVTIGAINYRLAQHLERAVDQQHCPTCTCHLRGT
jgi:transposase